MYLRRKLILKTSSHTQKTEGGFENNTISEAANKIHGRKDLVVQVKAVKVGNPCINLARYLRTIFLKTYD